MFSMKRIEIVKSDCVHNHNMDAWIQARIAGTSFRWKQGKENASRSRESSIQEWKKQGTVPVLNIEVWVPQGKYPFIQGRFAYNADTNHVERIRAKRRVVQPEEMSRRVNAWKEAIFKRSKTCTLPHPNTIITMDLPPVDWDELNTQEPCRVTFTGRDLSYTFSRTMEGFVYTDIVRFWYASDFQQRKEDGFVDKAEKPMDEADVQQWLQEFLLDADERVVGMKMTQTVNAVYTKADNGFRPIVGGHLGTFKVMVDEYSQIYTFPPLHGDQSDRLDELYFRHN
jgi:hypothetical protein